MRVLILVALTVVYCDGARILALVPFPAKSHWVIMEPFFQELAARGHQMTVYSLFPQEKPLPNYKDVDLSYKLQPLISKLTPEIIEESLSTPWRTIFFLNYIQELGCQLMDEPPFLDLLKARGQYDLLITESYSSDCFTYFAHKLKIPLISMTTTMAMAWGSDRMGLPDNPSYIPTNYLTKSDHEMSFWERFYNTAVYLYGKFYNLYVFSKSSQERAEKFFGEPLPPVHEVVANTSLLLLNSHHTLSQSRPFPPNVIEVAGIHIKEKQPLPKDLDAILKKAKHGAIIMSFGSLVRSSAISKSTIQMFMSALSKIQQTVIFKYEEDLPNAPSNVHIRKWIPQRDLVEHENVVAVIVHGGMASTVEAVHSSKPLIGVPFFVDQHVNIKSVVKKGAGVELDVGDLSEEKISAALSEILINPKYKEGMNRLSQQFQDRPMTPLQSAVYWTEYVIRHQGAPHLRPASVGMPFYQYLLLDVAAAILVIVAVVLLTVYLILKRILSAIVGKGSRATKKVPGTKKNN